MKLSMGPAFFQEIPCSQMKVGRIQGFFLYIEPVSAIRHRAWNGRRGRQSKKHAPKKLGGPKMEWVLMKCKG